MKNSIEDFFKKYYKNVEFTEADLKDINEMFSEESYEKDEVIFQENVLSDKMYFVINGMVKAFLKELDAGKTIALMKPGEIIGEIAFFDKGPHSAGAKALVKADLFVLDLNKFNDIKKTNPALALKITNIVLETFAKRLRGTTRKMYGLY